jgi:hypothetical protein
MKLPPQLQPPAWDSADAEAFQALQRGDCPPHLQQRALNWLITKGAGAYDLSFAPADDRLTSFAEGRRFVGLQVIKLLKLDIDKLRKSE